MDDFEPVAGYKNKRELLEDLYVRERLSISQVAARVGHGVATIDRWLRLLEIPRRGRGGPNNPATIGWAIHRLDPRYVFGASDKDVSRVLRVSGSIVYKYKRGVMAIWNSALSVQQQG